MKRFVMEWLKEWKDDDKRLPLLVRGRLERLGL